MCNYKILVVDDDNDIRALLKETLTKENYLVYEARDGKEALAILDDSFDLVILDVIMPKTNGILVCGEIRKSFNIPILFLSAKSSEYDKYLGLSIGGDDYLIKPFSKVELLARINSLIRRYRKYQSFNKDDSNNLYIKDLRLDKNNCRIYKNEQEIILTNIEYKILELLINNKNRIFTPEEIYSTIWNEPYDLGVNQIIMVHISNLRKKIGDDSKGVKYIKNIWGRGYCVEN